MAAASSSARDRVIALMAKLPEAQTFAHGAHLSLEVRGRRFGWFLDNHHGDGRLALSCRCLRAEAMELVRRDPARYHVPKYVGHRGWVGVWLDRRRPKWREVEALLGAAYQRTAPRPLVLRLFA